MMFKTYFLVCLTLVLATSVTADEPGPATRPAAAAPGPPASAPAPVPVPTPPSLNLRDPTEPQAALKQAIENMRGPNPSRQRAGTVPQVIRRGLVIVAGKPPEALIEVMGSGLFFVHEGSVISAGVNDGTTRMRIAHISADEIEIDVESQKQKVIIR